MTEFGQCEKAVLLLGVLSTVLLVLIALLGRRINRLQNPKEEDLVDTDLEHRTLLDAFRYLKPGMVTAEVIELMGDPKDVNLRLRNNGDTVESYKYYTGDWPTRSTFSVEFVNGELDTASKH